MAARTRSAGLRLLFPLARAAAAPAISGNGLADGLMTFPSRDKAMAAARSPVDSRWSHHWAESRRPIGEQSNSQSGRRTASRHDGVDEGVDGEDGVEGEDGVDGEVPPAGAVVAGVLPPGAVEPGDVTVVEAPGWPGDGDVGVDGGLERPGVCPRWP